MAAAPASLQPLGAERRKYLRLWPAVFAYNPLSTGHRLRTYSGGGSWRVIKNESRLRAVSRDIDHRPTARRSILDSAEEN